MNVVWQSNYTLGEEGFCLSFTGFDDGSICFQAATYGKDVTDEFSDIEHAREFMIDYVGDEEFFCESDFDFTLNDPKN